MIHHSRFFLATIFLLPKYIKGCGAFQLGGRGLLRVEKYRFRRSRGEPLYIIGATWYWLDDNGGRSFYHCQWQGCCCRPGNEVNVGGQGVHGGQVLILFFHRTHQVQFALDVAVPIESSRYQLFNLLVGFIFLYGIYPPPMSS